jgi:hypothetical protein
MKAQEGTPSIHKIAMADFKKASSPQTVTMPQNFQQEAGLSINLGAIPMPLLGRPYRDERIWPGFSPGMRL